MIHLVLFSAFGQKESENYLDSDLSSATESMKWNPEGMPRKSSVEVIDVDAT